MTFGVKPFTAWIEAELIHLEINSVVSSNIGSILIFFELETNLGGLERLNHLSILFQLRTDVIFTTVPAPSKYM